MRNYIIFFILFFNVTLKCFALQGDIDSLKLELNKEGVSDSLKNKLLLELSYYSSSPEDGLVYGTQALLFAQKCGFKKYEAYAYGNIGNYERILGNKLLGIEALIKSATLFKEIELFDKEALALSSIGSAFLTEAYIENSIKYYSQALILFLVYKDSFQVANTQLNIGEAYRTCNELDSAVFYFNVAFDNLKAIKDGNKKEIAIRKAIIQGNLGMVHFEQEKYQLAKSELIEAISFFKKIDDDYYVSVYQCELGKICLLEGRVAKGEKLICNSLEMAKEAQLKEQIRDFSLELSSFYEKQNLPDKALLYYKQYKTYDDSLKNVENVRKMEQQQSKFELGKKEEEISILNRINRLQRSLGYALSGGSLILIVFFFILFQTNRKIKLSNQKITEQNLLVEQREKEKALLLKELNHRVKNNLQMVASLLNLHARQLKDHPAAEALMEGKYRVEALTLIHQKLYRDDVDTKINIKDYIEELASNLVLNFGHDFRLDLNLEAFIMKIDKAIPLGLIINELITNSLKYGHENNESPILKIDVKNNKTQLVITIEDNGVGLPADFDFRRTESFGLKLVHSLVKQLGGVIEWESNKGTCWKLVLDTLKIS